MEHIVARLLNCHGINEFYLHHKVLTDDNNTDITEAVNLIGDNGEYRYKANPLNSDVHDLKLYKDIKNQKIHRCEILDLYCAKKDQFCLRLCVDILLIDIGQRLNSVWYDHIYDYGQTVAHVKDMEPEYKRARLYLGDLKIIEDCGNQVDNYFIRLINKNSHHRIKIIDCQDEVYTVEILNDDGKSISSHIVDRFPKMFVGVEVKRRDIGLDNFLPIEKNYNHCSTRSSKFRGALNYFKTKSNSINELDLTKSYVSKRFFKVRIISWYDPGDLAIIPADKAYFESYQNFKNLLENMPLIKNAESHDYNQDKPFQLGEFVLFMNSSFDPNLGKWLRGVVISISFYNQNHLSIGTGHKEVYTNRNNIEQMIEDNVIAPDDVIYRVRSVDYGYQCRSSHFSMRHLTAKDLQAFRSIGPWSLPCSLFGVHPLDSDQSGKKSKSGFSLSCAGMMDSWLRERILDNGRLAAFHVLFRTPIKMIETHQVFSQKVDISLFHRYEPQPISITESYLKLQRKTYYHNLNWFLVDTGFASDSSSLESKSSQVQLEEYIVNKLVKRNML